MLQRIAIALGGRSQQKFRMVLLRQLQAIHGAHRADPQGFDRMFEIIDRAGGRGEMKHVIYLAEIERPVTSCSRNSKRGSLRR